MKKGMLVLCFAMAGSLLASAQLVSPTTYDRHDLNSCFGWHLVLQKLAASGEGSSKVYLAGHLDETSACGQAYDPPEVGQKHAIGPKVPPHFGQTGTVLDVGDDYNTYNCFCLSGYANEWLLDLTDDSVAGYFAFYGLDGDYWWYLSSIGGGLPSKNSPNQGMFPLTMPKVQGQGLAFAR